MQTERLMSSGSLFICVCVCTRRTETQTQRDNQSVTENKLTVWQSTSLKTLVVQMMNMMEAADTKQNNRLTLMSVNKTQTGKPPTIRHSSSSVGKNMNSLH